MTKVLVPRTFLVLLFLTSTVLPCLRAADIPRADVPPQGLERTEGVTNAAAALSAGDAVVLGVVEGVTEYLPISSTGHLIIANQLLHLNEEIPLLDRNGQPLWYRRPSDKLPQGEPLTLKVAADTFTVVIQFGAIASVAFLYWQQILSMLRGLLGKDTAGLRLLRNLLIAFVPAAGIGFALRSWIEGLFSIAVVIAAQVVGAFIMFGAERWRKAKSAQNCGPERMPSDLTAAQSLGIGFFQCLALWPGMSRSMATIVGGYLAGLTPSRSAEFSFLLGLITLTAAAGYKSLKSGAAMIQVFGWPHILLGSVIAAVTAVVAVKFLVSFLSRHGLVAFAWYRLALAAVLGALMALGIL